MTPLRKILVVYIASGLLAVVAGATLLWWRLSDAETERWRTEQSSVVASLAGTVDQLVVDARAAVEYAAMQPAVRAPLFAEAIDSAIHGIPEDVDVPRRRLLAGLRDKGWRFSVVFMLRPNGDFYLNEPFAVQKGLKTDNLSHRPYFKEATETKATVVSDSFIGADGVPAVAIDVPILDEAGDIRAHLGGVLHLSLLAEAVADKRIGDLDFAFVVDRENRLVAHTDAALVEGDERALYAGLMPAMAAGSGLGSTIARDPATGRDHLFSFVRLDNGWGVGVARSMAGINANVSNVVAGTVAILALVLGVVGGLGMMGVRRIGHGWEETEERVRQSEALYRNLFTGAKAPMLLIDQEHDGRIVDANDAATAFYGWSVPTLKTMKISQINMLTPEEVAEEMRRARDEERSHFYFRHRRAGGDARDVEVHSGPFSYHGRKVLYSIIHDITGRKQAEKALKRSEERFRLLVERTNVVAWELDWKTFRFTYVSPQAEQVFGYPLDQWRADNFWADHIFAPDRAGATEFCLSESQQGRDHDFEYRMVTADGRAIWVRDIVTVEMGDDGAPALLRGFIVDIDERKKTEIDLKRSNAELEQFAYVASHDLQEPLRMVTSYLQLLERRYRDRFDDEAVEYIDYAVDGARRMSRLIRDLLEYSRIDRGGEILPVDAGLALASALDNLEMAVKETDARIDTGEMPLVLADEPQLVSLFQNLIGNALKYRHPDRAPAVRIEATFEPEDQVYRFSIADNGIGIEPRFHDRVFHVFQRLHGGGAYEGTGIGLAICKKIVDRFGGDLWIESDGKNGTTFLFTLPPAPDV